jgi:hypothetical protein
VSGLVGDRTRLRQVALVANQLGPVVGGLRTELGLTRPFHDPGVAEFGLENAVFSIGDTFLEVVAPVRPDTTAGRYLEKRGGDGGYMAIFQVPDLAQARRRVADLGVRVVWNADLSDMAAIHLHPKDVPGAIVSLDWAQPAGSWRWAGPDWAGRVPTYRSGGILGLTIAALEPAAVARCWASVLGSEAKVAAASDSPAHRAAISLDDGRQRVRFVSCRSARSEGIAEVTVALDDPPPNSGAALEIGGVRFVLVAPT